MTTPNNSLLLNASIAGLLAGNLADRWVTAVNSSAPPAIGTPDVSYAAIASFGTLWSGQTDTAVPNDHVGAAQPTNSAPISVVTTGVAIAPSSSLGGVTQAQLGKARLIEAFAQGIMEDRYPSLPTGQLPTGTQLAPFAQVVAAEYLAAVPNLQPGLSGASLPAGNNNLLQNAAFTGYMAAKAGNKVPTSTSSTDTNYMAMAASALTYAQAVDAGIVNDSGISQGSGLAAVPTTGLIADNQLAKTRLLHAIVGARARIDTPLNAVACYTACVGNISTGTSNPPNNNILRNAAFCGFISGLLTGRDLLSASSSDTFYVALASAAAQFALAVDAAVAAADISGGAVVPSGTVGITTSGSNPTGVTPSTGTIAEAQLGKEAIMYGICRGVNKGRSLLGNSLDTTLSTYSAIASSIVALYLEMATVLNTP
jgi:hypothetical protein